VAVVERKLEVLRAIIEDYIATNEPVGSKALADRHSLGVSPATIRNDMAALEEEGLIAQPHTSAGRIPTDAGYRIFVDRLTELKPLSGAEKRAIQVFLDGAADLDDVLHRAVRTLAQLTRHVAVVQYPSLSRSRVRHLELVSLSTTRLMLVLITDTGRVEQRVVDLPAPVAEDDVFELRASLNVRLRDRLLAEAPELIGDMPPGVAPELRGLLATLTTVLLLRLPGDPAGARGTGGAGRPAQTPRSVDRHEPGGRPHRQREPARGPRHHLAGHLRIWRARIGPRGGRSARPEADGLRTHDGAGGGRRTLRR
jgi:heat-inducible transcriptional repressor